MKQSFLYMRRLVIESATALHAGSGESDILQDMPVQVDYNGLPTINATSLAGALRTAYAVRHGDTETDSLFGEQTRGSRLSIGNAVILDETGKPMEQLCCREFSPYLRMLQKLPIRDNCRLNAFGSAADGGKFDRTLLPAGVRFMLEYEIECDDSAQLQREAEQLADIWNAPDFRIGGGSRNGFGKIRILQENESCYDLANAKEREAYLRRSASLTEGKDLPMREYVSAPTSTPENVWKLMLEPENFWITSDGNDTGEVKFRSKREIRYVWDATGPKAKEFLLLPATSIKGALAHRTAYYYNRLNDIFADKLSDSEFQNACNNTNTAVAALFGEMNSQTRKGKRGKVLLDDLSCPVESLQEKVFNHVALDRFTGGARKGMLFSEEAVYGGKFQLLLTLEPGVAPEMVNALKLAWNDLKEGRLPLGGGVMRGHGAMKGMEE